MDNATLVLHGIGASDGIAFAPAMRYSSQLPQIPTEKCTRPEQEAALFDSACLQVKEWLFTSAEKAAKVAGDKAAEIFDAHCEILEDGDAVLDPVHQLISGESLSAAQAVDQHFRLLADMMKKAPDPYMAQRADDFLDLREQLLRVILNCPMVGIEQLSSKVILVAQQLNPSDTVKIDFGHVVGIVCESGSRTSHSAILSRSMGIPAVVGCPGVEAAIETGAELLMDGATGEVILSPEPNQTAEFQKRAERLEAEAAGLAAFRRREACTTDGLCVRVLSNVASPEEVEAAVSSGADGVGLFRSEFLYMNRSTLPTEEEQFTAYKKALQAAQGRPVTIRTIDIGGDKSAAALDIPPEDNPFLGYRAIRICLNEPSLFLTQLRALYRASIYGKLQIMFPMISSLEELRSAKASASQAQKALEAEKIPFDEAVPLGIMVEVPSTAILADAFAREVDFFSIGTNDLVQYTLAVDRGNKKIEQLYSHYHPAVIRLIASAISAAARAGIECCMCGEAAGDIQFTPVLLGLGLDHFSVSPPVTAKLKRKICLASKAESEKLLKTILEMDSTAEIKGYIGEKMI